MSQTIIETPDSGDVEKEYSSVVLKAKAVVVRNKAEHGEAVEVMRSIALAEKRVKDLFEEPKRLAHAAHKSITTAEGKLLAPLLEARGIVHRKATEYEIEEERVRQEAQAALEKAAHEAEVERQLAEAVAADEAGDKAGAEEILAAPVEVPAIKVAPALAKVEGASVRQSYGAEVHDLLALVKHVAAHPEELALLQPNGPAINARARSMRDGFKLPGCRLVKDAVRSFRRIE